MKIIFSPAKKMKDKSSDFLAGSTPVYLSEAETILTYLKSLSHTQLQKLWNCNDKIAAENFCRLEKMDLHKNLTPALQAYDGIAFQYMAPSVFEYRHFDYLNEHLLILSGFYGALKPDDGVVPYRLEMQAKAQIGETKNLYEFWGNKIYTQAKSGDGIIINLASKEYSKCVENYLCKNDRYITVDFAEEVNGRLVTKGTLAKMARGEMVRFMAEEAVENPDDIKRFNRSGYSFHQALSTDTEFVFLKK